MQPSTLPSSHRHRKFAGVRAGFLVKGIAFAFAAVLTASACGRTGPYDLLSGPGATGEPRSAGANSSEIALA